MADPRTILERELADVALRPFTLDTFHRRRDRKHRNHRIRAGLAAAVIGLAGVLFAMRAFDTTEGTIPAGPSSNGGIVFLRTDGLYVATPGGSERPFLLASALADECPAATQCRFWPTYEWSPDGRHLAFVFGSSPDLRGHHYALYVVDADGTNVRVVTGCEPPDTTGACTDLAWSPDGTEVAVNSSTTGLWVVDVDSGAARTIAGPSTQPRRSPIDPAWSPDGTAIAYRQTNSVQDDIRIVSADGTSDSILVAKLPDGQDPGAPSWSPDGTKILFASQASSSKATEGIWMVGVVSGSLTMIVPGDSDRDLGDASWSPDGRHIMWDEIPNSSFLGIGSPFPEEIWLARADGSDAHRVYRTGCCAAAMTEDASVGPTLSPDGMAITFSVIFEGDRASESGVYVISLDGSGLHRVSTKGFNPAWQPIPADTP